MPLLFTFSEYLQANKSLCDLPGLKPGQFSIVRYDNQELRVSIQSRVTDNHCYIIGSVSRITVLPVAPVLREILLRAGCHAEAAS